MVAASKEGELQGEFGDWFADDQDDELYRVLEPIARKKDLLEDLEYTSNVVLLSCYKTDGSRYSSRLVLARR